VVSASIIFVLLLIGLVGWLVAWWQHHYIKDLQESLKDMDQWLTGQQHAQGDGEEGALTPNDHEE